MRHLKGSTRFRNTEARDDKLAISSVKGDLARRMFMGFMRGCANPREGAEENTDRAAPAPGAH